MKQVHERLYGGSHLLNDRGQYLYYGRVGGCLITGNEDNDFTNRNNVHDWNLMHLAWLLKDAGGVSAYGNQRSGWDSGCRFDFDTPTTDDRR